MLAVKAWKEKNFEEGLGWAYSGLKLNPKNKRTQAELYNVLGVIYKDLKSYELAEANYKKALEFNEKAYWVIYNLGNIYYFQKKKYDDAERMYKEVLSLNPEYFNACTNLGFLLFDMERFEEALDQFNISLEIESDPDKYAGKAISLSKLGRQEEALNAYKTAVSQDSKYLDLTRIRDENFWSEEACEASRELIERL